MKKQWIGALLLVAVVAIVSTLGILYVIAKQPQNQDFERIETLVLGQDLVDSVTETYAYHSVTSYITVIGTKDQQEVAYIVDSKDSKTAYEVLLEEGITEEQAEELTRAEHNVKEILSIKLGYEEIGPVWEVTYLNENDALSYTYLDFKTGDWWKRISNL
ncbi:hypothetical protein CQS04_02385 [Chryseomicrobium excrementi]|uniref:DUF5590 domain-containing protein n=1 Tax=Chryseomicrobium excrementi TaxID=2041346 RepID=A0A2M9F2V1_9BACL|nr:hypothetical protein [Chryseomicrobium excrementi]PJK17745.1 hypothetical protein CQS04_02385 [Chryseomicrobium excrementi]